MNATIREWVDKADGDYRVATREAGIVDHPNFDAVCYHAQQCVEKLMKALLIRCGVTPPKTHNLSELDARLRAACPDWHADTDDLDFLSRGGTKFRYPGEMAEAEDATDAMRICDEMRTALLELLNTQ